MVESIIKGVDMFNGLVWLSNLLSALGAINWGTVMFFNYDMIARFSEMVRVKGLDKVLYATVAIAGVYSILALFSGKM